MMQYKAGYKFVDGGVHAQVIDFPAAITCADDLSQARRLLALALMDVAEAALETGLALPVPNPLAADADMDLEEPIYLHLQVSSDVQEVPSGVVVP
jgi:predicted RNase H-like HicB family nuclease